ncbi:N-acetyltransferase [Paucibacter sp. KBW04]|uniref:GNAT family N-acetyltransferase n=1 Tax=Paucibacter sp. KBW04 TaxID=2153361 RepID=UPI000F5866CF|nr:GNAT family N-acetyltransferase [Paucibacter sp. KBW04]RQO56065.1 N-acetyltransferase [Paucibacter sp. KBW04]
MTEPTIQLQTSLQALDWEELHALYQDAGLSSKTAAELQIVFGNSRYVCFAREGERLVGAGRALSDGLDVAYLADIAVLPSHQGMGLGQRMVNDLLERLQGHRKIILYAAPGKEPFYKKFGFKRMLTAMAIFANPQQAQQRGYLAGGEAD